MAGSRSEGQIIGAVHAIRPGIVTLRAAFRLNYTEGLAIQLVSFAAFGVMSLPAASLANRLGPVKTIIVALATMMAGCTAVRLALPMQSYAAVLAALFVLAAGINILQVAANPLAAALGPMRSSHFRLSLAQAFNSLGVVLGVHFGSLVMLGDKVMAAQQGKLLVTSFHPELSNDDRFHRYFVKMAESKT